MQVDTPPAPSPPVNGDSKAAKEEGKPSIIGPASDNQTPSSIKLAVER